MKRGANNAFQPTRSTYALGFPSGLRPLGAAERGRWALMMCPL